MEKCFESDWYAFQTKIHKATNMHPPMIDIDTKTNLIHALAHDAEAYTMPPINFDDLTSFGMYADLDVDNLSIDPVTELMTPWHILVALRTYHEIIHCAGNFSSSAIVLMAERFGRMCEKLIGVTVPIMKLNVREDPLNRDAVSEFFDTIWKRSILGIVDHIHEMLAESIARCAGGDADNMNCFASRCVTFMDRIGCRWDPMLCDWGGKPVTLRLRRSIVHVGYDDPIKMQYISQIVEWKEFPHNTR